MSLRLCHSPPPASECAPLPFEGNLQTGIVSHSGVAARAQHSGSRQIGCPCHSGKVRVRRMQRTVVLRRRSLREWLRCIG
mmetsp:Transcript_15378/g.42910  ORF Transcript_15378/g.42910 Transcript_15378/m.42910 type:complete len:80 (+) Transcript_15378:354-593(+)